MSDMWGSHLLASKTSAAGLSRRGLLGWGASCVVGSFGAEALARQGGAASSVVQAPVEDFSQEEKLRLASGRSVKRKFHLDLDDVVYRAGLSYRLVRARPLDVVRVLRSPQGIARSIPYGIEATTVEERDGVSKVRIRQGKPPIIGKYTVRMRWEMSRYRARFWLDPNHKHDVRDIWGWFSAKELSPGLTLISFAVAFDLGGVGELLGAKAHRWSLSTADRIAKLVEERLGTPPLGASD